MYLEASGRALSGIKRSIFYKRRGCFVPPNLPTESRKCLFENAFPSEMGYTTIINDGWPEYEPSSTSLITYSKWRTLMVRGDPAFVPIIWSIQGSMEFISE